jgi:hypothetical protein
MARRHHPCDVPGCGRERDRWQRLCPHCFRALPAPIRTGIIQSFKFGLKERHREWKRLAAEHMAPQLAARTTAGVSAAQAYALANRITGDRDEDWPEAAE